MMLMGSQQDQILSKINKNDLVSILVPQSGVTVLEGEKAKAGGVNYYQQFGKLSIHEYETMKNQINVQINNKPNTEWNNNINANKHNNTIVNTNNFNIGKIANQIFQKEFKKETNYRLNNILINNDNIDEMKSKFIFSENNGLNSLINNEDLFKKRKISVMRCDKISNDYEEMNKFNLNIIKNQNWGTNGNTNKILSQTFNNKLNPIKPAKIQLQKELSENIIKTKMPRSRVKTNQ